MMDLLLRVEVRLLLVMGEPLLQLRQDLRHGKRRAHEVSSSKCRGSALRRSRLPKNRREWAYRRSELAATRGSAGSDRGSP